MNKLEDLVMSVVKNFVDNGEPFTALDVSTEVKMSMPFARHKEIRDIVRDAFVTTLTPLGYSRTPITVTLADGTDVEALLYHSLSDTWDLDNKYDASKRNKTLNQSKPVSVTASASGSVTVMPTVNPLPSVQPPTNARVLWQQMFNSQPSLFPRK